MLYAAYARPEGPHRQTQGWESRLAGFTSAASPARFGSEAARHDGIVKTVLQFNWKLVDVMLAIDGDGLAGCVENDLAVAALADMGLDLRKQLRVDLAIEVVGQLGEEIGAGHGFWPSFFCRK